MNCAWAKGGLMHLHITLYQGRHHNRSIKSSQLIAENLRTFKEIHMIGPKPVLATRADVDQSSPLKLPFLTLSQTTYFGPFQTERGCRRQFQI